MFQKMKCIRKGFTGYQRIYQWGKQKLKRKYTYTSMLVKLNDHAIQIQLVLEEVKDKYNVILQSCFIALTT
jgi:hypothetical protein